MIQAPGITKLKILSEIKKKEVILPIMRKRAIASPLLVGDDVALRTSVMSPDLYDSRITKMIYEHLEFPDDEKKMTFNAFIQEATMVDKHAALWGILSSTYEKIEDEEVNCTKCGTTFKINIPYDELIHDDTFTLWEENLPPSEFVKTVSIPINKSGIKALEVDIGLLPLAYRLGVLRFIPVDKIRSNFEQTKSLLSLSEQMATITKEIRVISDDDVTKIDNLQEILIAYNSYLTYDVIEKISDEFTYFNKYTPKFYVVVPCNNCGEEITYYADMEIGLFRSYLRWART